MANRQKRLLMDEKLFQLKSKSKGATIEHTFECPATEWDAKPFLRWEKFRVAPVVSLARDANSRHWSCDSVVARDDIQRECGAILQHFRAGVL